jgi:hypothetical protein
MVAIKRICQFSTSAKWQLNSTFLLGNRVRALVVSEPDDAVAARRNAKLHFGGRYLYGEIFFF